MRHRVAGRTFGRRPEQRRALLRGLANALIDYERIETTVAKAKELRRVVEPLITLAKRGDLHARRQAASYLYRKESLKKLFGELADRFRERQGGYTRILHVGRRIGDGAELALIEFLRPEKSKAKKKEPEKEKESTKKAAPKKAKEKPKAKAKKEVVTKKKASKAK